MKHFVGSIVYDSLNTKNLIAIFRLKHLEYALCEKIDFFWKYFIVNKINILIKKLCYKILWLCYKVFLKVFYFILQYDYKIILWKFTLNLIIYDNFELKE